MTCEEFERILVDSSSSSTPGGWMLRASREALLQAHVQDCPACATKMAEAARLENALNQLRLSRRHIEAPATVEGTRMTQHLTGEQMHELTAATPMGRLVRPDDVAETVAFFASDDSGFTTGHYIPVSGGVAMD